MSLTRKQQAKTKAMHYNEEGPNMVLFISTSKDMLQSVCGKNHIYVSTGIVQTLNQQ